MKLIELSRGMVTKVDDEDYEYLSQYKWYAQSTGRGFYAARTVNRKCVLMHRELTEAPKGRCVDHINGNTLDNTRDNLRVCSNAQNTANGKKRRSRYSKYKGVSWSKLERKWKAYIRVNYKQIHLGTFDNEVNAAKAYNEAATKHFREFARLNSL